MEGQPAPTPSKVQEGVCVACGEVYNKKRATKIVKGKLKQAENLTRLLMTHGGINVNEGSLCHECYSKVSKLEKLSKEFRDICTKGYTKKRPKRMKDTLVRSPPSRALVHPAQRETMERTGAIPKQKGVSKQLFGAEPAAADPQPFRIPLQRPPTSVQTAAIQKPRSIQRQRILQPKPQQGRPLQKDPISTITQSSTPHPTALTERERWKLIQTVQEGSTKNITDLVLGDLGHKFNPEVRAQMMNKCDNNYPAGDKKKSVLGKGDNVKTMEHLQSLNWQEIFNEAMLLFPLLMSMMISIMLPRPKWTNQAAIVALLPRLGLIYSILLQARVESLSRVQNVITTLLTDSLCESKIFDRLQRLGVCLTHKTSIRNLGAIKGGFHKILIAALQQGKHFRIVGDNIDFSIGVRDERKGHHAKLHHYFGSAILLYNHDFRTLSMTSPQQDYRAIAPGDLLPSEEDISGLVNDYVHLIIDVAVKYFPAFKFLERVKHAPSGPAKKTESVPLPALHRNEQDYNDVCEILRFYEKLISYIYAEAHVSLTDEVKIHIGGDQLTRERFSGAKRLMIRKGMSGADKFVHLQPISFEFFHLSMKMLNVIYKRLYKESSDREIGTMKSESVRIARSKVKKDATKAYTPNKEFFVSFVDCYIVEALCHHFKLADHSQTPLPNAPDSEEEQMRWAMDEIKTLVHQMVGTFSLKKGTVLPTPSDHTQVRPSTTAAPARPVTPAAHRPSATQAVQQAVAVGFAPMTPAGTVLPTPSDHTQVRPSTPAAPARPVTPAAHRPSATQAVQQAVAVGFAPARPVTPAAHSHRPSATQAFQQPVAVGFAPARPVTPAAHRPSATQAVQQAVAVGFAPARPVTPAAHRPSATQAVQQPVAVGFAPARPVTPAAHRPSATQAVQQPVAVGFAPARQVTPAAHRPSATQAVQQPVAVGFAPARQVTPAAHRPSATQAVQQPVAVGFAPARQVTPAAHRPSATQAVQQPVAVGFAPARQVTPAAHRPSATQAVQQPVAVGFAPARQVTPAAHRPSATQAVQQPVAAGAFAPMIPAEYIQVKLPNGELLSFKIVTVRKQATAIRPPQPDNIQSYAKQVLEFGLLFKNFEESCSNPDRDKMLRTLKLLMLLIWTDSPQAKYGDEILRFLVQQLVTMSERAAHEMFYSQFVNIKGRHSSSMPADLYMETMVRVTKKHIKSMVSNKNEANIFRRSSALAGLNAIATNYDKQSGVPAKSGSHTKSSTLEDEKLIINDLRELKPFDQVSGRQHASFSNIEASALAKLDCTQLHSWMNRRIQDHGSSQAL